MANKREAGSNSMLVGPGAEEDGQLVAWHVGCSPDVCAGHDDSGLLGGRGQCSFRMACGRRPVILSWTVVTQGLG